MKRLIVAALLVLMAVSQVASAGSAILTWDANTESDLAGYKLYFGNTSGVYVNPIDVGKVTTYTFPNAPNGTYFFAVTAYNKSGIESGFSSEVSKTINGGPSAPSNLRVQ